MAEVFKFFNSGVGDPRTYVASDFANYLGSVLSSGILSANGVPTLQVSVETGTLNTIVSPGKSLIKGYQYENTTPKTLTHTIPEVTYDRIDRIVLRLDLRNSVRNILLHVKEGLADTVPIAPVLQRDEFIYELSLAQILVRKNTVQLLQTDLIDERLITELCGLVTWTPKVPTDQFQAQWDAFMADIVDSGFASAAELTALQGELTSHKADYVKHPGVATTTNTGNAYAAALSPAPTAYVNGMGLVLTINADSTAAATINVDGLGVIPIKKANGGAVANLKANGVYTLRYSGTSFILQGEGGEYGTAVASDVIAGKTLGTESGIQVGTLAIPKGQASYTVPGSFVFKVPPLVTTINYTVVGAGGGSGGQGAGGGQQGGGGWNIGSAIVTPGQNISVIVGSPGAKGAYGPGTGGAGFDGGNGGTSQLSVTPVASASGGAGGKGGYGGYSQGPTLGGTGGYGGGTGGSGSFGDLGPSGRGDVAGSSRGGGTTTFGQGGSAYDSTGKGGMVLISY